MDSIPPSDLSRPISSPTDAPLDGLRGKILALMARLFTHPSAAGPIAKIDNAAGSPALRPVIGQVWKLAARTEIPPALATLLDPRVPSPRVLAVLHGALAAESEDHVRYLLTALNDLLTQWLIEDDERRGAEAEADEIAEIVRDARLEAARRALLETDLHGPDIPDAAPDTAPDGAA